MSHTAEGVVFVAGAFSTISVVVWAATKVYLRRTELEFGVGVPQLSGPVELRLERIEQAVEAIAIEVERVSEGQRFTTRLLTERISPLRVPHVGVPLRADTPH